MGKKRNQFLDNNSHKRDQARKSTGRMPWHQEPMKDVTSCDKLRMSKYLTTRRFPNGETRLGNT